MGIPEAEPLLDFERGGNAPFEWESFGPSLLWVTPPPNKIGIVFIRGFVEPNNYWLVLIAIQPMVPLENKTSRFGLASGAPTIAGGCQKMAGSSLDPGNRLTELKHALQTQTASR